MGMNESAQAMNSLPGLRIERSLASDGQEQFAWGMKGGAPPLTLIGYLSRVQSEIIWPEVLSAKFSRTDAKDAYALVIQWNEERRAFDWYCLSGIALDELDRVIDGLVGMLEMIKVGLVGQHMMQQQRQQSPPIFGPNGQPLNGGRIFRG